MTQSPKKGDFSHKIGQQTKNPAFQIRFSGAQFTRIWRFVRLEKINKLRVFSNREYSAPPACMILKHL